MSFLFFFSSRRRHTRCLSDWSSDVCSSDLAQRSWQSPAVLSAGPGHDRCALPRSARRIAANGVRSEESRVGKEWRSGWSRGGDKEKKSAEEEGEQEQTIERAEHAQRRVR